MNELPWIDRARQYLGLQEDTRRLHHNEQLLDMLESMGSFNGEARAWWDDDETPWCGLFVGYALGLSQRYVVKEWYRASAWGDSLMTSLPRPAYGCIVTFTRNGGGHVGFVVGRDQQGNLMVLGGNQGNAVSIAPFAESRATGYYWPSRVGDGVFTPSRPHRNRYNLPVLTSDGQLSENEA